MGSFKQLKSSDVITIPVIANRTWNFNYCPLPSTDPYIQYIMELIILILLTQGMSLQLIRIMIDLPIDRLINYSITNIQEV